MERGEWPVGTAWIISKENRARQQYRMYKFKVMWTLLKITVVI
jgi:hypothetical protein